MFETWVDHLDSIGAKFRPLREDFVIGILASDFTER